MSLAADAAGDSVFTPAEAVVDGTCVSVGSAPTSLNFCGPGKLTLSRMSCDTHDYKAMEVEHSPSEWTTNCETLKLEGSVVEGYLGSYTVKC